MIPKTIHYCWFGKNPMPDTVQKYVASWTKYCPDYTIKLWTEDNYDVTKNPYLQAAYEAKKYAFVSDFARLDIIGSEGGIYLDTDVELLRSLDDLLQCEAFMGMEASGRVNTGLGFGAVPNHAFVLENKQYYEGLSQEDGRPTCVEVTSNLLVKYGLVQQDIKQTCVNIEILPTDYLCPISYFDGKRRFSENTFSIHHYNESWLTARDKRIIQLRELTVDRLPVKLRLQLGRVKRLLKRIKNGGK